MASEIHQAHLTWGIWGLNELTNEKSLETGLRMCYFLQCQATGTKEVIYVAELFLEVTDLCIKDAELQCTTCSAAVLWNCRNTLQIEDSFPALRKAENYVRADIIDSKCFAFWWTNWHSSLANGKERTANMSTGLFFPSPVPKVINLYTWWPSFQIKNQDTLLA